MSHLQDINESAEYLPTQEDLEAYATVQQTVPTVQEQMKAKLESLPIASKEIKVYGSQIMITCLSENTAQKWHRVLKGLSPTSLRIGPGIDYAKENKGTNLCPTRIEVWRVWASL